MKRLLAITGPPLGGKSTFAARVLASAPSVGIISTGKLARRLTGGDYARTFMLDLGVMYPDQEDMMQALSIELLRHEGQNEEAVIVDGAPRFASQVLPLKGFAEEVMVLIVQPPNGIIRDRVSDLLMGRNPNDLARAWMQPQREVLWYGTQFHEIVTACVNNNVNFGIIGSNGDISMDHLDVHAAWLEGRVNATR